MAPIRFFCKHCNLMMKIGPQMFGRTVVCPQCAQRIEVPFESDPKAESLYRSMKQKRAEERAAGQPAATRDRVTEPDEFDRWIDEFWMSVPEQGAEGNESPPPPTRPPVETDAGFAKNLESASMVLQNRQARALFRSLLVVVFLLGCSGGFILHFLLVSARTGEAGSKETQEETIATPPRAIRVEGELTYRNPSGGRTPDADAVVLFLSLDRIPAVPLSSRGLAPNDPSFDPNGDASQQIEELGGIFQRTGADGSFSFPLRHEGRYLALMISSHLRRHEPELSPTTIRDLQRFFHDPRELLGEYCFVREEYDFTSGTYILRQTCGN